MKRIDTRRGWSRLTWQQQNRYCHLADLFDVDEYGDDLTAESAADYLQRQGATAQRNADRDALAAWPEPKR